MRYRAAQWLLAVTFGACAMAADDVNAYIEANPLEIPWHKTTEVSVVVEAPAGASVALDDPSKQFGGLVPFGDPVVTTEKLSDGRKRVVHRYTLEAPEAKPGKFAVGPLTVRVGDSEVVTVAGPEIAVRELTAEEEAQAQRFVPALDPLNVRKRFWEYWQFWAGVAALAALLTAIVALYLWLKRNRPPVVERVAPPWETALARLGALEARKLHESGQFGAFYVELSAILRHYLEDRFALHAPERTTPEFLAEAAGSGVLSDAQQRMLAMFLRYSDRVKFARHEPTREEAERNFADVRRFVEDTTPTLPPAEEAA